MQPQPQPELPYEPPLTAVQKTICLGKTITADDVGDVRSLGRKLAAAGWRFLDGGLYCEAFLSPCGERVVKVGRGSGSRQTIDAALEHPTNPHLPTVYGVLDLSAGTFAVEMECLERIDDDDYYEWADLYMEDEPEGVFNPAGCPEGPMRDAFIALIDARGYNGFWDCHLGNVMRRSADGCLVLNDLIS